MIIGYAANTIAHHSVNGVMMGMCMLQLYLVTTRPQQFETQVTTYFPNGFPTLNVGKHKMFLVVEDKQDTVC